MELKNILSKIENIEKDILDYITNTEHYLFYWISDKAVQNFIKEYPDDYEDMFHIIVVNVSASPTIRIYFEDHPDGLNYIEKYAVLSTFKDSAKARWSEWNGKVKEIQIAEKKKEIEYFKKKLEETEKELKELKKINNMKEQLDLVKILKDCPKGMKLDCTMYDNVTLKSVSDDVDNIYPICIEMKCGFIARLTKYGQNACINDAKCVIFPKGKTTWEGFQRPFVDGDVVIYINRDNTKSIFIYKEVTLERKGYYSYCWFNEIYGVKAEAQYVDVLDNTVRLATEEEKQKLFKALEDNGYRWNSEIKTLEKLIVPKFKVGDKIRLKENHNYIYTITDIKEKENKYTCGVTFVLRFSEQDNWELVPNKFDITTLKPFDKVLVRDIGYNTRWHIQFFETMYDDKKYPFMCLSGKVYSFCIPYNDDTKHLVGKSEEAPEFYRYWEE